MFKKELLRLNEELAFKLQAKEEEEEEEERLVREKAQQVEEANIAWDDVQAKINADYHLAQRLPAQEQEELTDEEKARIFVHFLEQRRKHFTAKRAKENRNRPPTRAQQRSIITELVKESSKKAEVEIAHERNDGDDVTFDATPLSTKSPTIMLKNFDREDLEVLWSIVKARFKKTKPVNYMDDFLLLILKTMFEHHVEDNVWKNQQGLVKVLNWKLYDSCGVHCMFNDVKLQVDYECEMEFELLRLVKKHLKEGYGMIVGIKRLLDDLEVTAAKVMATLVISISSDVSVESVGSSFPRVILIGFISVEVLVAPEVGADVVTSPVRVLELDTHSFSEDEPSNSSPPLVFVAHMVSPFLCSDDSESDIEIPKRHVSPIPHDAMLTRWRSRVASRLSSPTTSTPEIPTAPILPAPSAIVAPSYEFPLALVVAPPGIRRRRAILIRPGEDIPIGRLYHTHPGGPCRALTVRNSVRPLPSYRLALRYTSHHLDRFTSGSSSSHSSSNHSSSRHSISGHSLSRRALPNTIVADSSTPPRFVHLSLARTPRCSEAYLH
ncbi:hypothetical protein Tco_0261964 [Tanacetum coccineum]